jgi:hypothetical protein
MSPWDPANLPEDTPATVRAEWRLRFCDDAAAHAEKERRASIIRFTVLVGMLIGVLGCVLFYGS